MAGRAPRSASLIVTVIEAALSAESDRNRKSAHDRSHVVPPSRLHPDIELYNQNKLLISASRARQSYSYGQMRFDLA
jgi:hypothetical protein